MGNCSARARSGIAYPAGGYVGLQQTGNVSEQDNFGECEVQIATNSRDLAISVANHLTNPLSIEPREPRHFSGPETIMRP